MKKNARRALFVFRELEKNGGYIWAEYKQGKQIRVGKVVRGSLAVCETPNKDNLEKPHILKTLQIEAVREIEPTRAMSLKICRPPRTTATKWKAVGEKLACLVERKQMPEEWGSLFDSEQETICAEYLRNSLITQPGFPILKHLLLPIGRTMKDVDIYGVSSENKLVFAQVTFKNKEAAKQKLEKLKTYNDATSSLVFFCDCEDCEEVKLDEDVWVVPWKIVEKWLKDEYDYKNIYFNIHH
jgi:hypothetical protein